MDQITSLIHESIKNDIMRFIPRIANKKLSIHELEAIFFNQGNGYKMFMAEYDDEEAWHNLNQKEKNIWNSKAKKHKTETLNNCKAKKKDGSECTTPEKENGFCGKHKDYMKNNDIAKEIASKEDKPKEIKMKRKKIDGIIYLIDDDNKAFDSKTNELKGIYNPETKKIEQDDDFFDNSSVDESINEDLESDIESDIFDSDEE